MVLSFSIHIDAGEGRCWGGGTPGSVVSNEHRRRRRRRRGGGSLKPDLGVEVGEGGDAGAHRQRVRKG
jgi:hypothetical protein